MSESIITIAKWHEETFPDATLDGQINKFDEEYEEFYTAHTAEDLIAELADLFIVSCGIARFSTPQALICFHKVDHIIGSSSISYRELEEAIDKKMEKNHKRVWAKQENGSYHHTNKED